MKIEVSEIYTACQGEGPRLGRPSLFLRLRRCNLSCDWCDTKFTWDLNNPEYNDFKSYESEELIQDMIAEARLSTTLLPRNLVITGGEPLIWSRQLGEVIQGYRYASRSSLVEIETAGTIIPAGILAELQDIRYNVSPKLASSGNHSRYGTAKVWNRDALYWFMRQDSIFKIVVSEKDEDWDSLQDLLHLLKLVADEYHISEQDLRERIYLMPEGRLPKEIQKGLVYCLGIAQKLGVNVTTRLQVEAFGTQRRR